MIKRGTTYSSCKLTETSKGKTTFMTLKYCLSHSIEQITIVQKVIARLTGKAKT